MFHDRTIHEIAEHQLAFILNADACKLLAIIKFYQWQGAKTVNVEYLKRLGFTRRQWELATKGTRAMDGRKLIDKAPAKDGLEFYGIINTVTEMADQISATGKMVRRPITTYFIGEITSDKLNEARQIRQELQEEVLEDIERERAVALEPEPENEPYYEVSSTGLEPESRKEAIKRIAFSDGWDACEHAAKEALDSAWFGGKMYERKRLFEYISDAEGPCGLDASSLNRLELGVETLGPVLSKFFIGEPENPNDENLKALLAADRGRN
mgnify:CR=1 FL=1